MNKILAALSLSAIASAALAAYPEKPVIIVVPFAAGGPTDKVARDLAEVLRKGLGNQPVIIENVGGAGGTLGAAKVEVMRARLNDIAPDCRVHAVDAFVEPDTVEALVPADALVLDAIDAPRAKAALIARCRARGQTVIVCGAAGGRTDPLRLTSGDLALTRGDALLAGVRARLRRDHGFPREAGRRFGVIAVHSTEPAAGRGRVAPAPGGGAPLSCAGYGSLVTVTAPMGMAAAALAIDALRRGPDRPAR